MDAKIQQQQFRFEPHQLEISTKNEKGIKIKEEKGSKSTPIHLKYQVHFIQSLDVTTQTFKVVAFCPFTQISAYGASVEEASYFWTIQAREKYGEKFAFFLPKYLTRSQRKVWTGRNNDSSIPSNLNAMVYIWDMGPSGDSFETGVAFCPETFQITTGSFDVWQQQSQPQNGIIPNSWFDESLQCTPLFQSVQQETQSSTASISQQDIALDSSNDDHISLTPQYIN